MRLAQPVHEARTLRSCSRRAWCLHLDCYCVSLGLTAAVVTAAVAQAWVPRQPACPLQESLSPTLLLVAPIHPCQWVRRRV